MLTVLPIQSKKEQEELCSICGIDFIEKAFAYRADDNGFIGLCQFTFENDTGYIKHLSYAPGVVDDEAMIIMLRATMSFMHRCGLEISILGNGCMPENLRNLSGYIKNEDGIYSVNLQKFYGGHCH